MSMSVVWWWFRQKKEKEGGGDVGVWSGGHWLVHACKPITGSILWLPVEEIRRPPHIGWRGAGIRLCKTRWLAKILATVFMLAAFMAISKSSGATRAATQSRNISAYCWVPFPRISWTKSIRFTHFLNQHGLPKAWPSINVYTIPPAFVRLQRLLQSHIKRLSYHSKYKTDT